MIIPYHKEVGSARSYKDKNKSEEYLSYFSPEGRLVSCVSDHNFRDIDDYIIPAGFGYGSQKYYVADLLKLRNSYMNQMRYFVNRMDEWKLYIDTIDWILDYYANYEIPETELEQYEDSEEYEIDEYSGRLKYLKGTPDILTQALGYDKIERLKNTITTSRQNTFTRHFNYRLKKFNIVQIPQVCYDGKNKFYERDVRHLRNKEDIEMEENLNSILKNTTADKVDKYLINEPTPNFVFPPRERPEELI